MQHVWLTLIYSQAKRKKYWLVREGTWSKNSSELRVLSWIRFTLFDLNVSFEKYPIYTGRIAIYFVTVWRIPLWNLSVEIGIKIERRIVRRERIVDIVSSFRKVHSLASKSVDCENMRNCKSYFSFLLLSHNDFTYSYVCIVWTYTIHIYKSIQYKLLSTVLPFP